MKRFLAISLFLLQSMVCFSQLSLEYVENWIQSCDPEIDVDSLDRLYVVNGVPFEGKQLEAELEELDSKKHPWYIDYLLSESVNTTFMKPNLLVVLIGTTPKLKRAAQREKLIEVDNKFTDDYQTMVNLHPNPTDPVLIINNQIVPPAEAKERIQELYRRNVRYIQYVQHTSHQLYGKSAKNGAVMISALGKRPVDGGWLLGLAILLATIIAL